MLRPLLFSAQVLWTLVACGTASGTPVTLHMAAAANDRRSITTLLSQGADIEARDRSGATPLLVATQRNNVAAALALIAAGAVRPVIDTVYPLAEAGTALDRLVDGSTVGKILLEVSG